MTKIDQQYVRMGKIDILRDFAVEDPSGNLLIASIRGVSIFLDFLDFDISRKGDNFSIARDKWKSHPNGFVVLFYGFDYGIWKYSGVFAVEENGNSIFYKKIVDNADCIDVENGVIRNLEFLQKRIEEEFKKKKISDGILG